MKKVEIYLKEITVNENGIEEEKDKGENYIALSWEAPNFDEESKDAIRKADLKDGKAFKYTFAKKLTERRVFRVKCEGASEISIKVSSKISPTKFQKLCKKVLRETGKEIANTALPSIASKAIGVLIDRIFTDPKDKEDTIGETYFTIDENTLPEEGKFNITPKPLIVDKAITKEITEHIRKKGNQKGFKIKKTIKTIVDKGDNGLIEIYGIVVP